MDQVNIFISIIIIVVIYTLYKCHKSKTMLVNIRKESIVGMWSDDNENFLYIDKKQLKNGYNKGYIVRNDNQGQLNVKIQNNGNNKYKLHFIGEGADFIKKTCNAEIEIDKNKMTIGEEKLVLFKDGNQE